jgi:Uma2 family endonuclease
MGGLALRLGAKGLSLTEFEALSAANPHLRLELTATGELAVMPPTGSDTGRRNQSLGAQLWSWNRSSRLGVAFDSSTGFLLPNGAVRSPGAAWVERSRWEALGAEQRARFAPLCPDFVAEIVSPTDDPSLARAKLVEHVENGARLGWLLDPAEGRVEVYRPGREAERLVRPASLNGEAVLPGFVLDLSEIL